MKKKLLSVCMVIAICILSFGVVPVSATTYGDLTYEIVNGEIIITACNEYATLIEIPNEIDGYPVTTIGTEAFIGCYDLTSVIIPDSVITVEDYAFYRCSSLTNVTIGNNVKTIGKDSFFYCQQLTSIIIPDSVTYIGENTFSACHKLKSVIIGNGMTSIEATTFQNCSTLTNVVIGSNVKTIGRYAFGSCILLSHVNIPDSVTTIKEFAFHNCRQLTSLTIGNGLSSIGQGVFYTCNILKKISYNGTSKDWSNISISEYNDSLLSATKHFFFYVTYIDENGNETSIMNHAEEAPDVSSFEKANHTVRLYTDKEYTAEFDKSTPITENITLYVTCTINQHTYKFLDQDGSILKEETVDYETEIIPPANPSDIDPYTFDYWDGYTDGMTATSDVTFTAVYRYKDYTITAEGLTEPISVTYSSNFTIPPQTKNDYCYFIGYFTEKEGNGTQLTNEKGESLKPYDIMGNVTVYPHFYVGYMDKIALQGTASAAPGDTIVQKAIFATEKNASYLMATICYPEWLVFKSISGIDFIEATKNRETTINGYKELQITCVYDYKGGTIPTYKNQIPFELKFEISTNAPIGKTEITIKEANLIGDEDYNISKTELSTLEVLPKRAEKVQISGPSTIDMATKYTATVSPDYTTDKSVVWSVDKESIATVSKDGILTPITSGTVVLTATAKDGSNVYSKKTVTTTVYAKIDSLTSDCGTWETNFTPEIYTYTVYVKNNVSSITLTPSFVGGTLIPNGTGLWISGRPMTFALPNAETNIILKRSNVENKTDKTYKIAVVKLDEIQTEISEDGLSFKVQLGNVGTGKIVFLALYENGRLAELQSATYEESPLTFTTTATYTSVKVMVWKSVDSSKPVYEAKIIK
ncbi:MAG: hypothetical protein E7403_07500 [Ruminococcaceae bacterium]|nr:hypothetical protein [Oscillospiraceae bacterium]